MRNESRRSPMTLWVGNHIKFSSSGSRQYLPIYFASLINLLSFRGRGTGRKIWINIGVAYAEASQTRLRPRLGPMIGNWTGKSFTFLNAFCLHCNVRDLHIAAVGPFCRVARFVGLRAVASRLWITIYTGTQVCCFHIANWSFRT